MISALLLKLDPFLGAIKAAAILALLLSCVWVGHHFTKQKYELKLAQADRDRVAAVNAKEREMQGTIDNVSAAAQKEKQDEKDKYDALAASYRAGANRLRVNVANCTPASTNSGVTDQQARAELLPETSARLVELVRDADDTVRDLNQCVDKYNAVKQALDPG